MIKRLKYHEIDFEKYDDCVLNSLQYRIYAESWYLDAVSGKKWDCLVLGDYEAVMPLPYVKKWGLKMVVQPLFCQQLGVFSVKEIDAEIFNEFENKLHRYWVRAYQFNEENTAEFLPKGKEKHNYLLPLNKEYKLIFDSFKKDRKKDIRRIEKKEVQISYQFELGEFQKDLIFSYPHLRKFYENSSFIYLIQNLQQKKRLMYLELRCDGKKISRLLIADSYKRKIILFSKRDVEGQYKGAYTYLLNDFIINHANTDTQLDFEGSMIPGVAMHNESFRAEKKLYIGFSNLFLF